MGNKIFVGGLNWRTTEPDLKAAFSRYADVVSVRIIIDRETGRSKCFGFLEFADPSAVPDLIERCDGMKLDGRHIKVSAAKERPAPVKQKDTSENTEVTESKIEDKKEEASDVANMPSEELNTSSSDVQAQVESPENGEASAHA